MGLFSGKGMKDYSAIAARNSGKVAILLETRNGKKSPATKLVMIVKTPRQYTIKMNELKIFFETAFDSKYPERNEFTYCRYSPVDQEFDLTEDFIRLKGSGEVIAIKKVPYYSGLLDR